MKKIIVSKNAPAPIGPYSQAVQANGMLFVSGQVALDPVTGEMKNQDIVQETQQVMKNLQAILTEAGLTFDHVLKSTIFVKDLNNFATVNQVYGEYFKSNPPARETVEVARLPKDAGVEISVIAVL